MGLLLYKSDEMFSATELIRKSKMIFEKIVRNDIEKAIIMRDGKPSFLLMDFEKYESIMAEFQRLKQNGKKTKTSKKTDEKRKEIQKESKKESIVEVQEKQEKPSKIIESDITTQDKEQISIQPTEEQEISDAFSTIEGMNFDDNMKKEAQEKIRMKILQARKERAEQLALQDDEEDEQELQIKQTIEVEKLKKEQELKEFWD